MRPDDPGMIDVHCHVLPGVDDGPPTVDAALAMVHMASADGIATIVATPHVDAAHPRVGAASIRAAVDALQVQLDDAGAGVHVVPGAEVAATRAMELDEAELRALTLGGGPWLLLECPLAVTHGPGFPGVARALAGRGHRIVLAHPERSPLFLRAPQLLDELVAEGMLAQATAGALSGRYGRAARDFTLRAIERGTVQVLASDGHGPRRPARIAGELAGAPIEPAVAHWLTAAMPAALLAGSALPPRPRVAPPASWGRLRLAGRARTAGRS